MEGKISPLEKPKKGPRGAKGGIFFNWFLFNPQRGWKIWLYPIGPTGIISPGGFKNFLATHFFFNPGAHFNRGNPGLGAKISREKKGVFGTGLFSPRGVFSSLWDPTKICVFPRKTPKGKNLFLKGAPFFLFFSPPGGGAFGWGDLGPPGSSPPPFFLRGVTGVFSPPLCFFWEKGPLLKAPPGGFWNKRGFFWGGEKPPVLVWGVLGAKNRVCFPGGFAAGKKFS